MKKYALLAVAILCLTTLSRAQDRVEAPAPSQDALERSAAPPALPNPPAAQTSQPELSSKGTAPALRELSPWSMFLSADVLVKAVMISLAFASFVTWTIFLAKSAKLHLERWQLKRSLARVSAAKTLAEAQLVLGRRSDVLFRLLLAATQEVRMSADSIVEGGIKERAASRFTEIVRAEMRAARQGMGVLATIGATAPFVGLFGTVWGIMNSFIGISKSQTTNLAVVAPGIAEALLATACGLAAAIPAVIFYNQLTRTMRGYLDLVGRASGAIGRILSRDLERTHGRLDSRAAE
jgi:biopolymer transport protein ExbB